MLIFRKCNNLLYTSTHVLHFRWWLCLYWCIQCWEVLLSRCTLPSLAATSLGPTPLPSSTVSTSRLPRTLQGTEKFPLLVCLNYSKVAFCGIKLFLVPWEELHFSAGLGVSHFCPKSAPFLLYSLSFSLSVSHIHLTRAVLSKSKLIITSEVSAK